MKVSVYCITYNHEPYIAQAIDSFLMQKTDFDVEIVIGEDCSTDNTRKICLDYEARYPGKIRVLKREKNIGMMANTIDTFSECDGKYIALCEGDDFWIDRYKLQKQVDFLEKNPDYTVCCHNIYFLVKGKLQLNTQWDTPDTTDLTYLLRKGNYLTTLSTVYRNHPQMLPFLQKFNDAPFGDYLMHLSAAMHGKIKFMKQRMAVYRAHSGGVWSGIELGDGVLKILKLAELVHDRVPTEYQDDVKIQIAGWIDSIARNEKLKESVVAKPAFKELMRKMGMPPFFVDYLHFSHLENTKTSFFTKHISLTVLRQALRQKISNKISTAFARLKGKIAGYH